MAVLRTSTTAEDSQTEAFVDLPRLYGGRIEAVVECVFQRPDEKS